MDELPASFAQERLWFFTQLEPDLAVYNLGCPIQLGPVDPDRLIAAFAEVVRRHETLRTSLATRDGRLVQVIHPEVPVDIVRTDLRDLPPAQRAARLQQIHHADSAGPIPLDTAPLWRCRLIQHADDAWQLLFVVHHAVFDASSLDNFYRELDELYRAALENRPPAVPDLAIQYADFAAWQRDRWAAGELADQLAYWRKQLADLPGPLNLSPRPPDPAANRHAGGAIGFELPEHIAGAVHEYAQAHRTTPFVVLLAALEALLARLSGQADIVVGSPVGGRDLPEVAPLIGIFVNTLVLRADCAPDTRFEQLVGRVRGTVLDALDHQEVRYDRLTEALQPDRADGGAVPLHQVVFNLLPLASNLQVRNGTAKVDLLIDLAEVDGRFDGRVEYSRALFDEAWAHAFAARYRRLLVAALAAPDTPIGRLPITDAEERSQLIDAGRPPQGRAAPRALVTAAFADQVAARPDAVAVVDAAGRRLTYAELDRQSSRLAHHLADTARIGPDTPVALFLDSDVNLAVAVLAVLKAGGAYLPLDQQHPGERLRRLLADSAAVAVLTCAALAGRLPALDVPVIDLDAAATALAGRPNSAPAHPPHPDALAYLIYTSGSTGRPKGVGVAHRHVTAYVAGVTELLSLRPGRAFSMLQSLTFDFSVTMFHGALLTGGTLHLVPRDFAADAVWVAEHLRRDSIDYLKITPSHLAALQAGAADRAALLPQRALVLGGEAARWDWVRELRGLRPGCAVVNHYGPTETTVGVLGLAGDETPDVAGPTAPIGRPLAHAVAHILDGNLEPVPDGVVGELCVGGATVSRGYADRPAATAAAFVPDPFAKGTRLYRTGDRARRLPDGHVEFLGRTDDQVKVRGYRVEPGEVRAVLAGHPNVGDCAVVVRGADEPRLVAYVVGAAGTAVEPDDLRAYLGERLPEFMMPAAFVPMDRLPLAAHGKVDRSRLPDPTVEQQRRSADPPQGPHEEMVAALFERLLECTGVGRDDGFFALGGHSLLAIKLMSRLRAAFGVSLPLRAVFEKPTVAALAERVEVAQRKRTGQLPPVEPLPRDRPLLASYGQRRLWFLDQLEQARLPAPVYNTNLCLRVRGPLDTTTLQRSFAEVAARHEVLRCRFTELDGELVLLVHDDPEVPFRVLDRTEDDAFRMLGEESTRRFDLATQPPLRVLLARLAVDEHLMLITLHHVVNDAWSAVLLVRELGEVYAALADGRLPELAPLEVQYADFAAWQRARVEGELRDSQLVYWRKQLAGLPERLELPTDRPRPERPDYAGAHVPFRIPAPVVNRLRGLGADENASLFMALLTGFVVLLSRYSGQEDVVLGTPAANRARPELERLVGFFLNTLVVRADCTGDPTFRELLRQVRTTTLEAYSNQEIPFEALIEDLQPTRDLGGTPIVQVMFTLEDAERPPVRAGDIRLDWELFGAPTAKFDVTLYLWRQPAGLAGAVEYRTDLFDAETMERFAEHFSAVLTAAASDPDRSLSELPMRTRGDVEQVESWNRTARAYPGGRLHELVATQAARTPDAPALWAEGGWLSYAKFGAAVNQLANYLRARGVRTGDVVGVSLPRSADLVVAVHAVLAAGAAYLPLEPDYPDERLAFMTADAAARLVITAAELADAAAVAVHPDAPPDVDVPEDAPAYVIYTSGSTGRPKGVVISHRAIVNRLRWMQETFPLTAADRVLHKTPFSFDVSVWELAWPLMTGAGLVAAPPGAHSDSAALHRLMADQRVTTVHFVPSMLDAFLEEPGLALPTLRRVICSGEALSAELAGRCAQRLPHVELHNLYGPTEAAVDVTWHACRPGEALVPIGAPIANTRAEVLDRHGARVSVGAPGELCLAGVQLADAYLNRPALTAERFIPDPYGPPGARLYRTGDLARWLPAGEVDYLGRLDHQVKVRGFRVELGEVEAALVAEPEIRTAVVTGPDLVAYLIPRNDELPTGAELRARLSRRLPAHMIPAAFVRLAELPLTPNGKLDRAALPRPDLRGDAPFEEPATDAERTVAAVWAAVLGAETVGACDNFFALGGDSIRSLKVVARLRSAGYAVHLQDIFLHQTVRELAGVIVAGRPSAAAGPFEPYRLLGERDVARLGELTLGRIEDAYPLTALQAGMLFHSEFDAGLATYHDVFTLQLQTEYSGPALRAALAELVGRHPVLRTSFHIAEFDQPVQVAHAETVVPLTELDLSGIDAAAVSDELRAWQDGEKQRPFQPDTAPLLRFFAHRLPEASFALTISFHHAILDGWSVAALTTELLRRYAARLSGAPLPAAPPPVLFSDFVSAERGQAESADSAAFWQQTLADAPATRLPRLPGFPTGQPESVDALVTDLDADLVAGLDRLAQQLKAPLRTLLLAAHLRVLALLTGEPDVTTGVVTHGRPEHEAAEEVLGLFLNTVPVRLRVDEPSWNALIKAVFAAEVALLPHRLYPLLEIQRSLGRTPLLDALFDYRDFHVYGELAGEDRIEVAGYRFFEQTNLPFAANVIRSQAGGLTLQLKYDPSQFDAGQMAGTGDYYLRALADLVADPGGDPRPTASYLAADARAITSWNATARAYPGGLLPELVAAQAARTPDAPALWAEGAWLPYAEFTAAVNRLARHLRAQGVRTGDVVGVRLERGRDLVVAVHAVVAAGAAYLPLEPDYPDERLAFMTADAGARRVITDAGLAEDAVAIAAQPGTPPGVDVPPDAPAYVIYTSGSTGVPKGVVISHRAIVNRLQWMQEAFSLSPADRVLHKTPFSFDVSVWELFWPLMTGAGLVVAPPGAHREPAGIADVIVREHVTLLHFVPSMLDVFLAEPQLNLPSLRRVVCSGEALAPELVGRFGERLPGVELHNLYGPTEAAVDVTCHTCAPDETLVPIGRPIANTRLEVLTDDGERVPIGTPGELRLGGAQLAPAYLNRPALTAERFTPDPYGAPGTRLYRTGDLARWLHTAEIEYLGRIDHQVKIRGFRVELGEIEAALANQPEIRTAVVTGSPLVAYLVPHNNDDLPSAAELHARLSRTLPAPMIPAAYVRLGELPLTPNGKLDRAALPNADLRGGTPFEEPGTEAERAVAAVWAAALGGSAVGANDNFFALGGDSIRSLKVVAQLRAAGYDLELQHIFRHPTVRELAEQLTTAADPPPPAAAETPAFGLLSPQDLAALGGDRS